MAAPAIANLFSPAWNEVDGRSTITDVQVQRFPVPGGAIYTIIYVDSSQITSMNSVFVPGG